MTNEVKSRQLSQDQRRALTYVRANAGVTTRDAALALQRSQAGMLSTLRVLEGRKLIRAHWPNRPGNNSWEWSPAEDLDNA